ncbi:hypothetical protein [Prevotella sp. E2-28]|uniref:hypothetical protein n=1 Tax=Prevotella sp. E2-28 TaxID=2913620 RepID=UPI001EDB7FFE|nr:hypothetical protein [Prevotella sp. E2-28]UKK52703.1 hypothetical protein L6465_08805 [Prevotella sp. E2-28]
MEKIKINDDSFVIKEHITHFGISQEKKDVVEIYLVSSRLINVNCESPDTAKDYLEFLKSKFE